MSDTFYAQNGQLGLYPLDDYTGTDDQKMASALAAVFAASPAGGTIVLGPRAHTFANQWATTYSAGVATALRIQGAGVAFNGAFGTPTAATTATFTYSGAGAGCADFQHIGTIEITGIRLASANVGVPLVFSSNATPDIHGNVFSGGGAGFSCATDAIVLGGTGTSVGAGDTAPYQGYQGRVYGNYFDGIRRIAHLQNFANSVEVCQNTVSSSCGSNLFQGGCIELSGSSGGGAVTGNHVWGNCIEMIHYPAGIRCSFATNNILGPNGLFDATAATVAYYLLDAASGFNDIADGYKNDTFPFILDYSGQNTYRTTHQSQVSLTREPQVWVSDSQSQFLTPDQGGPRGLDNSGNFALAVTAPDIAGAFAQFRLQTGACTLVTDGATINGSRVVTSLTAAWAASDIREAIAATGIPGRTIIEWAWTPTTAFPWQATTVYATGDIARPTSSNGHLYQASTGGTTGSSAPTWPTSGGTVTDGSVVWQDLGTAATAVLLSNAATATGTGLSVTFGRISAQLTQARFSKCHWISAGSAPTAAVAAGAGSGATCTIAGTDAVHTMTLTTGTSPASGLQCTVTFNLSYGAAPKIMLTAVNANAPAALALLYATKATTTYTLTATSALAASTAYIIDVMTMQ